MRPSQPLLNTLLASVVAGGLLGSILLPPGVAAQQLSEENSFDLERGFLDKSDEQEHLGNIDAAIAFYTQAKAVCEKRPEKKCLGDIDYDARIKRLLAYKAHRTRGLAAVELGDWSLAIRSFEAAHDTWRMPEAKYNVALAYDRGGGRELWAIIWYNDYLNSVHVFRTREDVVAHNAPRVEAAQNRLVILDVGAESAIMQLIGLAEQILFQQAMSARFEFVSVAKAYAALGQFDKAWEAYHLALRSHGVADSEAKQAGNGFAIWHTAYTPVDVILSIAMEQMKRLDFGAALRSADVTPPEKFIHNPPAQLPLLRSLLRGDNSVASSLSSSAFTSSSWLLIESRLVYSRYFIRDWVAKHAAGTLGEDKWDYLQAAAIFETDSPMASNKHSDKRQPGVRRYTVLVSQTGNYWKELRDESWFDHLKEDWRVLARKSESTWPGDTAIALSRLAQQMAELLFYLRTVQNVVR